jgi:5-deoxy-D-glucuronate isomerase
MLQLIHKPLDDGYNRLIGPGDPLFESVQIGLLRQRFGGEYHANVEDCETVLILLAGEASLGADSDQWDGLRRGSLLEDEASSVLVPRGKHAGIRAKRRTDVLVIQTILNQAQAPLLSTGPEVLPGGAPVYGRDIRESIAAGSVTLAASSLAVVVPAGLPAEASSGGQSFQLQPFDLLVASATPVEVQLPRCWLLLVSPTG